MFITVRHFEKRLSEKDHDFQTLCFVVREMNEEIKELKSRLNKLENNNERQTA